MHALDINSLCPICPESFTTARKGANKGKITNHPSLGFHGNNPSYHPHGKHAQDPGRRAKRARAGAAPAECDLCGEDE